MALYYRLKAATKRFTIYNTYIIAPADLRYSNILLVQAAVKALEH
jgi:hypothetical protein